MATIRLFKPHKPPESARLYFLPEQVAEYDKKRMTVREILQLKYIGGAIKR